MGATVLCTMQRQWLTPLLSLLIIEEVLWQEIEVPHQGWQRWEEEKRGNESKDWARDQAHGGGCWWQVKNGSRIADSSCDFITSEYGSSANMECIMTAQALHDPFTSYCVSKKHSIMTEPKKKAEEDKSDKTVQIWFGCLDTSLLTSGFNLDEPTQFAGRTQCISLLWKDGSPCHVGWSDEGFEEDRIWSHCCWAECSECLWELYGRW